MKQKSIVQERGELQRKAQRGEISPSEYWRDLQRTWKLMTPSEKALEYARVK